MDMWLAIGLVVLAGMALAAAGVMLLERRANRADEVDRSRRRRRATELDSLEGPHRA